MDILFNAFLVLHICSGATGLLTGTINIARRKGDKTHRLVGRIFMYAMLTAGSSALVLSGIHQNYFLFIVGVFTIYQTATGRRYLYFWRSGGSPGKIDWALTGGMMITAIVFLVSGVQKLSVNDRFGIVFIVFGFIAIRFSRTDFVNYKRKEEPRNYWLTGHLQRMTGSYVAALTAFLVVNGKYLPSVLPGYVMWLLPTAILVPLIIAWSRKYGAK